MATHLRCSRLRVVRDVLDSTARKTPRPCDLGTLYLFVYLWRAYVSGSFTVNGSKRTRTFVGEEDSQRWRAARRQTSPVEVPWAQEIPDQHDQPDLCVRASYLTAETHMQPSVLAPSSRLIAEGRIARNPRLPWER